VSVFGSKQSFLIAPNIVVSTLLAKLCAHFWRDVTPVPHPGGLPHKQAYFAQALGCKISAIKQDLGDFVERHPHRIGTGQRQKAFNLCSKV
jgi:hypothetical protein